MSENSPSNQTWQYPVVTFDTALGLARVVADAGGANVEVQKAIIARALGSSDSSGAFMQRLATARVYGMIEGSRSGYRLTDAAKRYFFPSSDAEKQSALLLLLKSAPIFSEMIKRFDGNKIPPADMLANVLLRDFKIPESWKGRVARFFVKAATDAGLLDSQGFLRYSAARHSLDKMPAPTSNAPSLSTARDTAEGATIPPSSYEAPEGMNAWVFSLKGKTVKVESSDELSDELWKKLNAYIQVLKPFEEETKK